VLVEKDPGGKMKGFKQLEDTSRGVESALKSRKLNGHVLSNVKLNNWERTAKAHGSRMPTEKAISLSQESSDGNAAVDNLTNLLVLIGKREFGGEKSSAEAFLATEVGNLTERSIWRRYFFVWLL